MTASRMAGKPRSCRLAVRLPAECRDMLDQLRQHWHLWSHTDVLETAIRYAASNLLFSGKDDLSLKVKTAEKQAKNQEKKQPAKNRKGKTNVVA